MFFVFDFSLNLAAMDFLSAGMARTPPWRRSIINMHTGSIFMTNHTLPRAVLPSNLCSRDASEYVPETTRLAQCSSLSFVGTPFSTKHHGRRTLEEQPGRWRGRGSVRAPCVDADVPR